MPLKQGELVLCRRGPRTGLPRQPTRDRRSFLYPDDLLRIANAHDFAQSQGLEFRTHITLLRTYCHADGVSDLPSMQERALQILRKYSAANGWQFEYIWVRECSRRKRDHLHLATTIPETRGQAVHDLLTARMKFSRSGVRITPADNPYTLMRYFSKSLHPDLPFSDGAEHYRLRDYLGLDPVPVDDPLPIRRAGASKGLGPAAQAKAGFPQLRTIDDLQTFLSGERDLSDVRAKRKGWDDVPPDVTESSPD